MEKWLIQDYEKRCFNLLLRLGRVNLEKAYIAERGIRSETKKIMKSNKCDKLTALKKYKAQLFKELIGRNQSGGTETVKGGNNA